MLKSFSIFGWKAILRNYGWTSFGLDSILPTVVSLGLCTLMYVNDEDVYLQLKHLVSVGISIVPAMVALILTAYTIMHTFIINQFALFAALQPLLNDAGMMLFSFSFYIIVNSN